MRLWIHAIAGVAEVEVRPVEGAPPMLGDDEVGGHRRERLHHAVHVADMHGARVQGRIARVLQHLGPADDLEEITPVLVVVGQDRHPAIERAERSCPQFRSMPELYRPYRRSLSQLARTDFSARLWCLWRRAKPLVVG